MATPISLRNPFPGMNPYLEAPARWSNVHGRLIAILVDDLDVLLPPGYSVNMQERCRVVQTRRSIYPDLYIERERSVAPREGGLAVAPPPLREGSAAADLPVAITRLPVEPHETYIDIVDAEQGNRVVTTLEVLSPINKTPGAGQELYLTKQQEALNSSTHLIEIDLLRAGAITVASGRPAMPDVGPYDYIICLHRGGQGARYEVWPNSIRGRLPRIAVPLTNGDADAVLDLQAAVNRFYDFGRLTEYIDYTQPPDPPLTGEDAAWTDALLREKGLRA